MFKNSFLTRMVLSAVVTGALAILAGATSARADDYGKCQDKLAVAESRLNRDIDRHGPYSHQARNDRDRVDSARYWCTTHHVYNQNRDYRNSYDAYGYPQGRYR